MSLIGVLQAFLKVFCGSTEQDAKPPVQQQPTAPPAPPTQPVSFPPHRIQPPSGSHEYPPISKPASPPHHVPVKPPHRPQHHEDQNKVNQQDEHYTSLRTQANIEGDQMAQSFQQSHEAYARHDGALAKQLSDKGKQHQKNMVNLNKQASDWIFTENNKDSKPGEIDLHGLYVKEAIAHTDIAIQQAKQRGDDEIRLIVGKGLHSQGGLAKIKPAIEELMQKEQLVAELDPSNAGILIVHMNADTSEERSGVVGPDEISRHLEKDDGRCTIM